MATETEWGLTDRGFRRPSYTELLDAYEYKGRELFGGKANLTVRSPLGLFMRIFAWMTHLLFSLLEAVYNSRFIDTAVGTSLYRLGKAIGMSLLTARKATGELLITGTNGTLIPVGWLAATGSGTQYVTTASWVIMDGSVTLAAEATIIGPLGNTDAGTVTVIVNPVAVSGVTAVTNPRAFGGGRARETDAEFRARYYLSVDKAGGVNVDAIAAAIMQNVQNTKAIGFENDTDTTNSDGLPPHSIEMVVDGGSNEAVAAQIFESKAGGIQTFGSSSAVVTGANGQDYTIYFSRPEAVLIYVSVTNLLTNPLIFPPDGNAQIQQVIIAYITGEDVGGIPIGGTVYYPRFAEEIYKVPGVIDFKWAISSDGINYSTASIPISNRQIAATNTDSVSVT